MRLIRNSGNDRVIDELHRSLSKHSSLDVASPSLSLFAFAGLRPLLDQLQRCRLVVPLGDDSDLRLQGTDADRSLRNQLIARALAKQCAQWIASKADVRPAPATLLQSTILSSQPDSASGRAITGNRPLTTEGLGLVPGNPFSLIQCSENADEWALLSGWFASLWDSLPGSPEAKARLLASLQSLIDPKPPSLTYHLTLYHLFRERGDELDEDKIIKMESRTFYHETHEPHERGGRGKVGDSDFRLFGVFRGSPAPAPAGSHVVYSVGAGVLLVCLSPRITAEEVESLALGIVDWQKAQAPAGESTLVFRDGAFADDVAKTNLAVILQQHGLQTVRSI